MRTSTQSSIREQNKVYNANVHKEYTLDVKGREFLRSEGICVAQLPRALKAVEITALNVMYSGIGIRNLKGGMEFYSTSLSNTPVTVRRSGITYIPRVEGHRSDNCCLFSDFIDYLSFLSLRDRHQVVLPDCDCLIMSSISNFMQMLHDCKKYDKVYCFFPNTTYGKTLYLTVSGCVKRTVRDFSDKYKGSPNIHQYIKELENNGKN